MPITLPRRPTSIRWLLFLLLLVEGLVPVHLLRAQETLGPTRFEVGGEGSYLVGSQSGTFPVFFGEFCGFFDNGTTDRIQGGLRGIWRPSGERGASFGARVGWERLSARYTATPTGEQRLRDPETREIVTVEREYRFDLLQQRLLVGLDAGLELPLGFRAEAGVTGGLLLEGSFEQSDNILAPVDRSFANGESSVPMEPGIAVASASLMLEGRAALGRTFQLASGLRLRPAIGAAYDLLPSVTGAAWRGLMALGNLQILVPLRERIAPPLPPPALPVAPPALLVEVEMMGSGEAGTDRQEAVIEVHETLLRRYVPFLPIVYFDSLGSTIPPRFNRLEDTTGFDLLDLAELDPLALTRNALNLVALRTLAPSDLPQPRIILRGEASRGENPALARAREATVRDYLQRVWGLPTTAGEGFITTAAGPGERRRVIVESDDPSITAPLATEQIVRRFTPPNVSVTPVVKADAGVARWRMIFREGERMIGSKEGFGTRPDDAGSVLWRIEGDAMQRSPRFLEVELSVTDSTGRVAVARDTVPLRIAYDTTLLDASRTLVGEREEIVVELVGFPFRSDSGTTGHRATLRELAAQIVDGATVSINGFADPIGEEQANVNLSLARAQWAVTRLQEAIEGRGVGAVNYEAKGSGADPSRYPHGVPEGRALSRGVVVKIHQQRPPEQ